MGLIVTTFIKQSLVVSERSYQTDKIQAESLCMWTKCFGRIRTHLHFRVRVIRNNVFGFSVYIVTRYRNRNEIHSIFVRFYLPVHCKFISDVNNTVYVSLVHCVSNNFRLSLHQLSSLISDITFWRRRITNLLIKFKKNLCFWPTLRYKEESVQFACCFNIGNDQSLMKTNQPTSILKTSKLWHPNIIYWKQMFTIIKV